MNLNFFQAKQSILLVCGLSVALNLFFLGLFFVSSNPGKKPESYTPQSAFPYLSARIFVQNQNDLLIHFVPLRTKLNEYQKARGNSLGLYFEYLPTGTSIGINEKQGFVLASLLKVPLAMSVYAEIEKGSLKETDDLVVQASDLDDQFGELFKEGEGTHISVQEALERMLKESDNTATNVLLRKVPSGAIDDVFDSLDIPKELTNNAASVTPKNYTSILRSLYLSSYLTKEHSNAILEMLDMSNFNDKLARGVEAGIPVAHKIGVVDPKSPTLSAYTDCGIVYVPKRPYALCLMVRADEKTAQTWMSEVSAMVYEFVSQTN